jgi:hypothetical protein
LYERLILEAKDNAKTTVETRPKALGAPMITG